MKSLVFGCLFCLGCGLFAGLGYFLGYQHGNSDSGSYSHGYTVGYHVGRGEVEKALQVTPDSLVHDGPSQSP